MSEQSPPLPSSYFGYPDLAGVKTVHARLVQRQEELQEQKSPPDEFLDTVADFVIRAQATGHVLGHDDDRTAAQNIIDYWVTVLLRGRRTPPETGLAEFRSPAAVESLRDRPVAEYLAEERTTIRRRLGLSAAAAQWEDAERPRALLWGGRQLDEAANYDDLSALEREFIAASRADERRSLLRRRVVLYAALLAATTIAGLVVWNLVSQKRNAEASSRQARHLYATKLAERSGFMMRQGDIPGALLWLTAALTADQQAEQDEKLHRLRIGAARAQLPKLEQAFLDEKPEYLCANARFSSDGAAILTISNEKGAGGIARLWEAKSGRLLAEFSEPNAQVNDAGFCADGRVFTATGTRGSGAGRLRFWQRSGEPAGEWEKIGGAVLFAVASPDADRLGFCVEGSGGQPFVVEVRRVSDGRTMTGPLRWDGEVRDVSFSPEGEYFVACGSVKAGDAEGRELQEGQVRVWNAWTGGDLNWEMRTTLPVNAAAFGPDNLCLVAGTGRLGTKAGTVEVWEVFVPAPAAGPDRPIKATQLFRAEHSGSVVSVCFSPDGRRVLSASHDETARVWEARLGTPLLELRHESSVFRAAYSPDGRWIISGGRDQTARVWNVTTGRPAVAPLSHSGTVAQVRFDPAGERVLTTSSDGARLWHLRTGEPVSPILKLDEPVWKMTVSEDGGRVVAVGRRGAVGAWETATGKAAPGRLPFHEANAAFFSADASRALISARPSVTAKSEVARLYQLVPEPKPGATLAVSGPVTCAVFSPDGARVFVACEPRGTGDGAAGLWDVATGKPAGPPLAVTSSVTYAAFSPDGRYLLTTGGTTSPVGGEARVWDAATGEALTPPLPHDEQITHASFNGDFTLLITASVDDSARIWTIDLARKTATEKRRLVEHSADLGHASFSPDGRHAVTASYDRTAMLWRLEDGARLALLQHPGWINDAQFDARGKLLVTACSDQIARVWEVATGDLVALFRHSGDVTKAFFSPDGDVVTLSFHAPAPILSEARPGDAASDPASRRTMLKVQTWHLPSAEGPVEDLADFAQILRSRRIENERDLVRLKREEFAVLWKKHAGLFAQFAADVPPVAPLTTVVDSEATGEWFAAYWHLSRLLATQPADADLLARRGFASTNLRNWEDAVADYESAVALRADARTFLRLTRADLELGHSSVAVTHATKGLEMKGLTPADERELFMMRAEGHAAQEQWEPAAADLIKAIALLPRLASGYERLAAVRLKQNQAEEYRRVCAQLVERAQGDDSIAGTAAWACALHPSSMSDPQVAVDLAKLTLARRPTPYYDLNTLGAVLYRAGNYEQALEYIRQSRSAYFQAASLSHAQGLPNAAIMPIQDGRPVDWLFLAMINEKLGNRREAEDWLKRAVTAANTQRITDPRRIWHRIEVELLIEEANALVGGAAR